MKTFVHFFEIDLRQKGQCKPILNTKYTQLNQIIVIKPHNILQHILLPQFYFLLNRTSFYSIFSFVNMYKKYNIFPEANLNTIIFKDCKMCCLKCWLIHYPSFGKCNSIDKSYRFIYYVKNESGY